MLNNRILPKACTAINYWQRDPKNPGIGYMDPTAEPSEFDISQKVVDNIKALVLMLNLLGPCSCR